MMFEAQACESGILRGSRGVEQRRVAFAKRSHVLQVIEERNQFSKAEDPTAIRWFERLSSFEPQGSGVGGWKL